MLELYHAGLSQASVKVRTTLKEKGLAYRSHYLRVPEGDHLAPVYLAVNPDGQVPALVHDGNVIVETSVINEYIDDAFPDPPLRPASAIERARMRRWSQIVDEHLFHAIATIGWAFGIGPILRERGREEFEKAYARLTIPSKRQKWFKAFHGFPQQDIDDARRMIAYSVGRRGWSARAGGASPSRGAALFARRHQRAVLGRAHAALVARLDEREGLAAQLGVARADDGATGGQGHLFGVGRGAGALDRGARRAASGAGR